MTNDDTLPGCVGLQKPIWPNKCHLCPVAMLCCVIAIKTSANTEAGNVGSKPPEKQKGLDKAKRRFEDASEN